MRFARLIAAAVVVVAVAAGGVFLVAPQTSGQSPRVIVDEPGGELEVFHGGGARIGVSVRDVDQADVTREKLASPAGAVVEEVRSDSPGAKAGIKSGDVILSFDGERVRGARQLARLVDETPTGRSVKLTVQRAGAKLDLDVTPEPADSAFRMLAPFEGRGFPEVKVERWKEFDPHFPAMDFKFDGLCELSGPTRRLGVEVQDLSDQLSAYFGVKSGLVVSSVDEGSAAAKAGLKAGDVITAVNGKSVDSVSDLRREVGKIEEGQSADLSITREKQPLTLKVQIEPSARKPRIRRTV
jgi:serine protease Do